MAVKLDLKRQYRDLYRARQQPAYVDVPELTYLMIDGHGDPNTAPEYADAVQALFAISYAAKFIVKRATVGADFVVMPLQGLWWADDMSVFTATDKSAWDWTMMILQPDVVTADIFEQAQANSAAKKDLEAIGRVRLERFREGSAAQILHVGPYVAEGPTIEELHGFIADGGFELAGKHHEIYLSDPRRSAPERMKTIIRQPLR